jgi:predicted branched-subunit amino acid permease
MPPLVRLYIRQVLIGFALAALFTALLIGFDVAGLRHLVLQTAAGPLAAALLVLFNGIVFAGVQFGIAVMALADRSPPRGGRPARPAPAALPVAVRAGGRRTRA